MNYVEIVPTRQSVAFTYRSQSAIKLKQGEQELLLGKGAHFVCQYGAGFAFRAQRNVYQINWEGQRTSLQKDVDALFHSQYHLFFAQGEKLTSTNQQYSLTCRAKHLAVNQPYLFAANGKSVQLFDLRENKCVSTLMAPYHIFGLAFKGNEEVYLTQKDRVCYWSPSLKSPIPVYEHRGVCSMTTYENQIASGSLSKVQWGKKKWSTSTRPDPTFGGDGLLYFKRSLNFIEARAPSK